GGRRVAHARAAARGVGTAIRRLRGGPEMQITRISHVNVNCADLARSRSFYEEFLDLTVSTHTNPAPQPLAGFGMAIGQWDAFILRDRTPGLPVRVDLLEW